jgi:tripartite-type tricarboxylate transporter receptor subunit TctC
MPFLIGFSLVARFAIACLIAGAALLTPATADEIDALKGKTVRVIIAGNAGSGTDTAARVFTAALGRILPDTTIRAQNTPGSGGAKAVKELQEADGNLVTVGIFNHGPIYGQLVSPETAPYDLSRVHWIGSLTKTERVLAMRSGLGGSTLETLRNLGRQPVIATSDTMSNSTIESLLFNAMFGLQIKVVRGTSDAQQEAMLLSGDIDVMLGNPFEMSAQFESGELIPVLRFGEDTVLPALRDVPSISQLAPPDVSADLLFLMETLNKTGRLVAAAPTTDPQIIDALRVAFEATVADSALIEEMKGIDIFVQPTSGVELAERLGRILGTNSKPFQDAVHFYLACGERMSDEGATSCK